MSAFGWAVAVACAGCVLALPALPLWWRADLAVRAWRRRRVLDRELR